MKKYLLLSILSVALLFASCGSDDANKNNDNVNPNPDPTQPVTVKSEWNPTTIKLVKIITLQEIAYPHTANCTKDYLQLLSNNTAKFYRYQNANCTVTEYADAFKRTGNNVSLNMLGYQINGVIATETDTYMEVHSDISEYVPLIKAQFPEYEQYLSLLEGGTVKLSFNKK